MPDEKTKYLSEREEKTKYLSEREAELVEITALAVMKEAGHICHFPEKQRKGLHELTDEGKDRVKHLVEIADAANLVGIETDGHIVLFSVGRQVTIIGQKAIGMIIKWILILIAIAIIIIFGWRIIPVLIAAMPKGGVV